MAETDGSQLGRWFDAYAARLVLYARQWLDGAAAEDAVQEVFLRLAAEVTVANNPQAWLFRAVRNAALSQRRAGQRRAARERTVATERPEWFATAGNDPLDAAAAQAALGSLPDEQREVVVLRIWSGLGWAECAQVIGEPVSTLFSRYKVALAAIRERMERPCESKQTTTTKRI